ncbi:MAG: hypothetical protein Kow0068_14170 [Marinilabiliales bacterium]
MKNNNHQKLLLIGLIISVININVVFCAAEKDTIPAKKDKGKFFANVYTGYYYNFNEHKTPVSAFDFPTGLLGYTRKLSDKVSGILIYDVTRTTNFSYPDTIGITNYFEGSKYTAFLKMGQINWNINKFLELNVGQLLNEQYLTVQDKFWGYRYIAVTSQEMYRLGMPADFGVRVVFYFFNKKLKNSITCVNGEGPFRYQDNESKFLISDNIEFMPNDKTIIKLYYDYQFHPDAADVPRMVISGFAGYKHKLFKIAGEYNMILNQNYIEDNNIIDLSFYGAYHFTEKIDILSRFDYLKNELNPQSDGSYFIFGFQYQPVENFFSSINYRYNDFYDYSQVYVNFGIKF